LEEVRKHRAQYRRRRNEEAIPVIALVGYTNAGKSTLLNGLSGSDIYAADQLFATLDPTTRRIVLPGGREVLITDTVGFIQKLPTPLIAAFRATLEEITDADLIIHVVDITHQNVEEQVATVMQVLEELGATDQPIITALNKIDALPHVAEIDARDTGLPHAVAVSALTGQGLPELLQALERVLEEEMVQVELVLPYSRGDLLGLIHQRGQVIRETHDEAGTHVIGRIPESMTPRFEGYGRVTED
jgi:GTP-binding protein HflX